MKQKQEQMKIALIGPTYPFRGGIAHYTTLLCRALREAHEVRFISFKRQYPQSLFPGKSDRDTSEKPIRVDDADYVIDSMNPLTWWLASRELERYEPAKIVLPWWVAFWSPPFLNDLTLYHEADRVGKSFRATPSRLHQL